MREHVAVAARPDLLLINPGNRAQIYQSLGHDLAAIEPPVWAGLMATFARTHGYSVELLDANAEQLTPAETAARVADVSPLLTAVVVYGHNPSASTQVMPAAGALCRAIRAHAPDTRLLMVGGHVSALPHRTMAEEAVDFVGVGEGVYTIVDLIDALRAGDGPDNVRGVMFRRNGSLHATPHPPLVQHLDREMPGVAWDLLPMDRYRAHNWHGFGESSRTPYASLYTTLGCPYHCSYCCIQAPFKAGERALGLTDSVNSYRMWSARHVVDQIGILVDRYGVRHLKFADEMFVLNPRHVRAICDLIIERGYPLNIWAYARVDTVSDDMPDLLKRAGINWLAVGIEAGAAHVRDDVAKSFTERQIVDTIARIRSAGINVIANYIFGLPEDTLETMQATLDLALELNCEFANFYSAMAYPGSRLYQVALERGWTLPAHWSGYSQHAVDTLPLPTRYLTAREVLRFRDEAFQTYFQRPAYRRMIGDTFGAAAVADIERMAAHTLRREALAG